MDYQLEKGKQNIAGVELEIVPLHGHTPGMIGVATADNVLFAGDSFFSVYILEKHGIPYFTGIREAMALKSMKHMHYEYYAQSRRCLYRSQDTLNANIKILQDTMEIYSRYLL